MTHVQEGPQEGSAIPSNAPITSTTWTPYPNGTSNSTGIAATVQVMENNNAETSTTEESITFKTLLFQNWLYVLTYCIVFCSFGMGVAFLGPTIFDLGCLTATDFRGMSWVFFVQLLLTLMGAISAGFLTERYPCHLLLLIATTGMPFMFFLIPTCQSVYTLALTLATMGWCMGCVDCIANMRMMQLFGCKVAPFLQGMHFFYGLGAFVSPLIVQPFLLNIDCTRYIDGFTAMLPTDVVKNNSVLDIFLRNVTMEEVSTMTALWTTTVSSDMIEVDIPAEPYELLKARLSSHVQYAFYIMGGMLLPIPLLVLFIYFRERGKMQEKDYTVGLIAKPSKRVHFGDYGTMDAAGNNDSPTAASGDAAAGTEEKMRSSPGQFSIKREIIVITGLTVFMMFIYDGLQSSYGDYIYSYALKSVVGLLEQEGAYLNACFWGLFAFGRLLSIPLATWLTSAFMLLCNIIGCCVTLCFILLLRHNRIMIYLGTCLFGLFLSSVSPTVLSLAEQYIHVTPRITSILIIGAAIGEMIFPVIVGNLFVSVGPTSFLSFCLTAALLSVLAYVALWFSGKKTTRWTASQHPSFIWLSPIHIRYAGSSNLVESSSVKYYSRISEDEEDDSSPDRPEIGAKGDYEMTSLGSRSEILRPSDLGNGKLVSLSSQPGFYWNKGRMIPSSQGPGIPVLLAQTRLNRDFMENRHGVPSYPGQQQGDMRPAYGIILSKPPPAFRGKSSPELYRKRNNPFR